MYHHSVVVCSYALHLATHFPDADDADAIAFFADGKLQQALKDWADKKGIPDELQRKLAKFDRLNFEESKKIAEPLVAKMREHWKI